ncbi:MAG TPA: nucleoside kinase [Ruminococcaceae bacterium]|nr:nucleoside kinase [Oscillospiraceae bacterium]
MKHFNFDEIDDRELINRAALKDPDKFVRGVESKYASALKRVCEIIAKNAHEHKIIMLCGPSGSGKTTTAAMMAARLKKEHGVGAVTISLDNFYMGGNRAPLLGDGRFDYESVYALNLEAINTSFLSLIKTGRCEMPRFDFKARSPALDTIPVELKEGDIAIVEGIHAMNPLITDCLPKRSLYKLYVSVESGIYENGELKVAPRDIRLTRRMIRDHHFRNSSPQHTLFLWDGVVEGEDKYLFPYADTADMQLNSFHSYEMCTYRNAAIELLEQVKAGEHNYGLARRLIRSLVPFERLDEGRVPDSSLIREFIGGSIYTSPI